MILIAGRRYGTAAQVAAALGPDVREGTVRSWLARHPWPADAVVRVGRSVYLSYDHAATIESAVGSSRRGRPRQLDLAQLRA